MKQAYVIGTDNRIVGTKDIVPCRADVSGFNEDGSPIHAGGSEVFWDNQKPMTGVDGGLIYMDEDGEEYCLDEIEFRDDGTGE